MLFYPQKVRHGKVNIYSDYLVLFFNCKFATPNDYNADGTSDPSVVQIIDSDLHWLSLINNATAIIKSTFGTNGNHLAPGNYSGEGLEPAYISSDGIWHLLNNGVEDSFLFGSDDTHFIAGADFDGDGIDDIAYSTNACKKSKSEFIIRFDPLNSQSSNDLGSGRGFYFKTFMDANGDGRDDICYARPIKKDGIFQTTFTMRCKDATTRNRIARFKLGHCMKLPCL